ncbi:MAG: hypothetical protein WBW16_04065 [Bacteroidota bacterium]
MAFKTERQLSRADIFNVTILVALTVILFIPSLGIRFLNDDVSVIGFSVGGDRADYGKLLSSEEVLGGYYRPLSNLMNMVDFSLWGWNPFGFHLTNLVLHAFNVVLVYCLVRMLTEGHFAAFVATLLFAVHPIHELSVLWIPGRGDLLCGLFYVLAVILWIRWRSHPRPAFLFLSLIAFFIALLSKEMAVSLPLLLSVIEFRFQWEECSHQRGQMLLESLRRSWPYFIVVLLYGLGRYVFLNDDILHSTQIGYSNTSLLHFAENIAAFAGFLLIPFGHFAIEGFLSAHQAIFLSALAGASILGCWILWKGIAASTSFAITALWIVVTLLPVLQLSMRWYMYLPSVGFCIGVGFLLTRIFQRAGGLAVALTLVLITAYSVPLYSQERTWLETSTLAERLLRDVHAQAPSLSDNDAIFVLALPAKLGGTPILNLGFPGAVHHLYKNDTVLVTIASKVVMTDLDVEITVTQTDTGEWELATPEAAYFVFSGLNSLGQEYSPARGDSLLTEDWEVRIEGLNPQSKVNCISVRLLNREIRKHSYFFVYANHHFHLVEVKS